MLSKPKSPQAPRLSDPSNSQPILPFVQPADSASPTTQIACITPPCRPKGRPKKERATQSIDGQQSQHNLSSSAVVAHQAVVSDGLQREAGSGHVFEGQKKWPLGAAEQGALKQPAPHRAKAIKKRSADPDGYTSEAMKLQDKSSRKSRAQVG